MTEEGQKTNVCVRQKWPFGSVCCDRQEFPEADIV
jgi:hypothetical protein